VYLNALLKQTPYPDWNKETCATAIEFPYSNTTIYWDNVNNEWYLDNMLAEWSPSMDKNPCGKCSSHTTHLLHRQNAFCYPNKSYSNGNLALSTPDEGFPKNTWEIIENYIQQTTCDPSYLYCNPIDDFKAEDWDSRID